METPAALRAEERPLPRVDALVDLYVALVDEPLAAVGTRVGLLLDVGLHVLLQLLLFAKLNTTAAAEEKLRRDVFGGVRLHSRGRVRRDVVCLQGRLTLAVFAAFQATEGRSDPGLAGQRLQVFREFRRNGIHVIVKVHHTLTT